MKQKICKCGHKRESHNKKFLHYEDCMKCRCNDFMRRERPDLSDKIMSGIIIGTMIMMWSILGYLYYEFINLESEFLDKLMEMTLGEFSEILMLMLFGFTVIWSMYILSVFTYFGEKRRITHPIEDE